MWSPQDSLIRLVTRPFRRKKDHREEATQAVIEVTEVVASEVADSSIPEDLTTTTGDVIKRRLVKFCATKNKIDLKLRSTPKGIPEVEVEIKNEEAVQTIKRETKMAMENRMSIPKTSR